MSTRSLFALLIISNAFVFLSFASSEITTHSVSDSRVISFPNTPPPVINEENRGEEKAEAPSSIRKLGKHHTNVAPSQSPTEAFEPSMAQLGEDGSLEAIHVRKIHRRSVDKSVAGGGVILGGLVTTFFVAIFCYIKATRRKTGDTTHELC